MRPVPVPLLVPVLLAALALVPGAAARADDGAVALLARLKTDLSLTDAEAAALADPVRVHLARGGREEGLRDLLGWALASGCRGACATASVRATNQALAAGTRPMDALQQVKADLAAALAAPGPEGGPPSEAALAEAVRARMDARLAGHQLEPPAAAPAPASPAPWPPKRPRLP